MFVYELVNITFTEEYLVARSFIRFIQRARLKISPGGRGDVTAV